MSLLQSRMNALYNLYYGIPIERKIHYEGFVLYCYLLHGLFVLGAYFDIRQHLTTGWILLVGVWVKVLHEQIYGASDDIATLIDANVAIDAHLFGTLSGTVMILYYMLIVKNKLRKKYE